MSVTNKDIKIKKSISNVGTEDDSKDTKGRKKSALDSTTSSKSIMSSTTNRESKLKPILMSTTPGV